LSGATYWASKRWVARPLAGAVAVIRKVADGDLTVHFEDSQDEVGELLQAADEMAAICAA
jgi:methyl-accepting chemotaxis protein-2 (aspartate sensor receptor)